MFEEVPKQMPKVGPPVTTPTKTEEIQTMPMEYYLGKDTVSTAKKGIFSKQGSASSSTTSAVKASVPMTAKAPSEKNKKSINIILIGGGVLVVLVSAFLLYKSFQNPAVIVPSVPVIVAPTIIETEMPVVEDPIVIEEPKITPIVGLKETFDPAEIRKQSLDSVAGLDKDNDGLTDLEETLIGTNPAINDTDGDTYLDGEEIANFYSPLAGNRTRLTTNTFFSTYENTVFGYKLFYPKAWLAEPIDPRNPEEVMISSLDNEFVDILTVNKPTDQTLLEWYLSQAPEVSPALLKEYQNYNKLSVLESPDGFTSYIGRGATVYVIIYNIGLNETAAYPNLYQAMVASFELTEPQPLEVVPVSASLDYSLLFSGLFLPAGSEVSISPIMVAFEESCGSVGCFKNYMATCTKAKASYAYGEEFTLTFEVLDFANGKCNYSAMLEDSANADWVGKSMTCAFDIFGDDPFVKQFSDRNDCSGELFDLTQK